MTDRDARDEDGAARGRRLLAERMAVAPGVSSGLPALLPSLEPLCTRLPRMIVTTGLGTSEGHARHLAALANRLLGQPARFEASGALARRTPPGAAADWLVVFSQGLSANARHALVDVEAWGGVVVVTGLPVDAVDDPSWTAGEEKAEWIRALRDRGVVFVDLGAGVEYGSLLRVVGARAGYVVAWSLLRTLAEARLDRDGSRALAFDPERLESVQRRAGQAAARAFPPGEAVAPFFAPERPLVLVAEGGASELADQIALKLTEGLLRPRPPVLDVLSYAHGPLQGLAERPASVLYLQGGDDPPAGADGGETWLDRLRTALDPQHSLRVVRAELPWPFAAVEVEAVFDHVLARALDETRLDLVDWPGADREAVLYAVGPTPPDPASASRARVEVEPRYESRVWPEIEAEIAAGRRTALLGLGSVEQHGPHLPLGTDRWIAEALLARLEARLDDAIALPAIAVGCASEHLDFAGTLHVEPETLEAVLFDLLASARRHGFERAFLFTAHGGNLDALAAMGDRLRARVAPLDLRIGTDQSIGAMQSAVVEAEAIAPIAAGPHAGEYETSVVARLRPGSVRRGALHPGRLVSPGEAQGLFYPSLRPNAETGVLGDPSAASASRGDRYLDAWVELLVAGYAAAFPATGDAPGPAKKRK